MNTDIKTYVTDAARRIGIDLIGFASRDRFDGVDARELLTMLDISGVYASAGAACNSHSDEPSPVLLASGLTEEQARQTIRLSFCPETSEEDFIFVAEAVSRCVSKLRNSTK